MAPAVVPAGLVELELDSIKPSKTNPRRHLNGAAMEELVSSVRSHGVLQPILVRPNGKGYELVAGHRRFEAARQAKLERIPAAVRELSDKEALEIQVIENLQRSDLHPLEEADGYRQLHDKHGYSVDQLAARVGKSRAYVYARLKLCSLTEKARDAFYANKVDASVAVLLARIPVGDLQAKALKEILEGGEWDGGSRSPMRYRAAADYIQRHYMLRLGDAPFDPKDGDLLKKAGPCAACPKRTGNQPELFGDVKGADVCTDPVCFHAKADASWKRTAAAAEEKGLRVLSEAECKKVFPHNGDVAYNAPFADLDGGAYNVAPGVYSEKKLKNLLGKHAPAPVLARDRHGRVHELVAKKELPELLKAAGVKARRDSDGSESWRKQARAAAAKAKLKAIGTRGSMAALVAAVEAKPDVDQVLDLVFKGILHASWHDTVRDVAHRRDLKLGKNVRPENAIAAYAMGLPAKSRRASLCALLVELIASRGAYGSYGEPKLLNAAGKAWKVNLTAAGRKALAAARKPTKKAKRKK